MSSLAICVGGSRPGRRGEDTSRLMNSLESPPQRQEDRRETIRIQAVLSERRAHKQKSDAKRPTICALRPLGAPSSTRRYATPLSTPLAPHPPGLQFAAHYANALSFIPWISWRPEIEVSHTVVESTCSERGFPNWAVREILGVAAGRS